MLDRTIASFLGTRYTAAVVRVERGGSVAYEAATGAVDESPAATRVTVATRFDLASLTKLFVATAALETVRDGLLSLDVPLGDTVLPEWKDLANREITLRMLLAHTSGLQSGADYRTLFAEDVERYALLRPLVAAPGERVVYSDLGFIALGIALARARRRSLASVVERTARDAGARATAYRPLGAARRAIPATEEDAWRGRVRGFVHDEKAYLLGGVAGHAGLFGTAADVAALGEAYLGVARGRGAGPLPERLAREALREQADDATLRRGLGWALKTRDDNSCGPSMSRATFGHTGFTGTSLWVDPERDCSVTILTNAVSYGRTDVRDVRIAIAEAALAALGP